MLRVNHERELETDAAKSRWFRSLPVEERMSLFVEFTELALQNRPDLAEAKPAQPTSSRIRVLRLPRR